MKRILIGAIAIAVLTGLGLVTPAHAVSHSVSINEARPSASAGKCARIGGSASGDAMAASGTISVTRFPCANNDPSQPTGRPDGSFVGQVTCVSVAGNQAIISGTVSSATGVFSTATSFVEVANDNSSPSSPPNPDTDGLVAGGGGPSCAPPGPIVVQPVTTGDIRIS